MSVPPNKKKDAPKGEKPDSSSASTKKTVSPALQAIRDSKRAKRSSSKGSSTKKLTVFNIDSYTALLRSQENAKYNQVLGISKDELAGEIKETLYHHLNSLKGIGTAWKEIYLFTAQTKVESGVYYRMKPVDAFFYHYIKGDGLDSLGVPKAIKGSIRKDWKARLDWFHKNWNEPVGTFKSYEEEQIPKA